MSWKRKLFFILDKLKISPVERMSVSALSVLLVVVAGINLWLEPKEPFGESDYKELKEEFLRRSAEVETENKRRLARYYPERETVRADTTDSTAAHSDDAGEEISENDKININTADAQALQQVVGVGPAYAERIVAYRDRNGDFTSVEQLTEIKGIGEKRLEKLKPFVKL